MKDTKEYLNEKILLDNEITTRRKEVARMKKEGFGSKWIDYAMSLIKEEK